MADAAALVLRLKPPAGSDLLVGICFRRPTTGVAGLCARRWRECCSRTGKHRETRLRIGVQIGAFADPTLRNHDKKMGPRVGPQNGKTWDTWYNSDVQFAVVIREIAESYYKIEGFGC